MKHRPILLLAALALPAAASAEGRELCTDRPGLGTPPCTVDRGRIVAELGLADWTRDRDAETREDDVIAGDLLVRFGVSDDTEVQLGWTAYGHARVRDRASGTVDRAHGTGDVSLSVRHNLTNPDGSGTSLAIQPVVTFPTGRAASSAGAGDWSAGLLLPVSFELSDVLTLTVSPEVDAAVDEDGDGRHLAYGSVAGLAVAATDAIDLTFEVQLTRDRDPEHHATQALAAAAIAWAADDDTQLDLGSAFALNHDTPDARLYAGVSRRF